MCYPSFDQKTQSEITKEQREVCAHRNSEASGKTRFELLDLDFAAAMCNNFEEGIKGNRMPNGWKNMKPTPETMMRYRAKILRHLHNYGTTGNPQDLAAIACNANILWHLEKVNR